ncbi:hypothetical protein GCM10009809_17950 [Isoptericola hypogeus]|uniref:Uncharacterized protein n=1 Tax=Isoptericola hypogeus TaxID=300179 RepID=A0ABN2JCL8_9MICO
MVPPPADAEPSDPQPDSVRAAAPASATAARVVLVVFMTSPVVALRVGAATGADQESGSPRRRGGPGKVNDA